MEFKDYYKALGVERDASAEDIRRAFRKQARKFHPDVTKEPDAESRFKEVNEAYEVLKDQERRQAYDQLGKAPPRGQGYQPPPGWEGGFEFSSGGSDGGEAFSEFFETLFRRGGGGRSDFGRGRARDSHARIEVEVEDAYRGATRVLNLRMPVIDQLGNVTIEDRNISVAIPAGIREGQNIRLAGQGVPAFDEGPAGDLFLEVSFVPHPVYSVHGADLYLDLPVTPWEAALGGKVIMPTPGGKVELRIPENARSGQKLRLKGKGLPGGAPGDIFATLKIVNPKVSTDEARAVFERMAKEMPFDPRAQMGE